MADANCGHVDNFTFNKGRWAMDTDLIKALETEILACKSVVIAANYLYLQTREWNLSRNCCYLWAVFVLMPSLRPWARKTADSTVLNDNTRLT